MNATADTTPKPRKNDVARWVAILAAPKPNQWNREECRADKRDRDNARGQLRSYGLDNAGHPIVAEPVKPAPVAPAHLATLRAERARIAAVLDALRFTPRAINGNVRGHLADALTPLYAAIEAADAQILGGEESAAINPT